MDCLEAREGLWPPERPKLAGDAVLKARRHLEECVACREFFLQDRALLEAYESLRGTRAPLEVRERVFDALAEARRIADAPHARGTRRGGRMRTRLGWSLAVAAGLAVVALGVMRMAGPDISSSTDAGMFVEDYLRRAVGEDHLTTSNPSEVSRFLVRELGMSLTPLHVDGLELEGVEICLLEGRRGAMIMYRKNGRSVAHYLVPKEGTRSRPPVLSPRLLNRPGTSPGVVTWASPSVEQALVGELSPPQLLQLAISGSTLE